MDMFVENGLKRTFLENLVKDYNVKKKKMTVTATPFQRKSCGYLILDQKVENNLKR